jgi:hypothetical protein
VKPQLPPPALLKTSAASNGPVEAGRPVLKRRHVMDRHQGAGLVENRDGALYADVDA